MPELPEVETVRRQLSQEVGTTQILAIEVRDEHCYEGPRFSQREQIVEILRIGKYLFVRFESGRGLQIHLKMTGRLIIESQLSKQSAQGEVDYALAPHTRVVMQLGDGRKLYYWDTRMFGYIKYILKIEDSIVGLRAKMGSEPWDISDVDLLRRFQKTSRVVKEVILDQSVLAGVGNIYANDGLWLAGIDPRRKANSLRLSEVKTLRESLCKVLKRGLELGGASDNTYRDFYGGKGGYQNEFLTYGRTGEPCKKCGAKLRRIVVAGRGTWMCEQCQK